jgi:hypothetical protein
MVHRSLGSVKQAHLQFSVGVMLAKDLQLLLLLVFPEEAQGSGNAFSPTVHFHSRENYVALGNLISASGDNSNKPQSNQNKGISNLAYRAFHYCTPVILVERSITSTFGKHYFWIRSNMKT